MTARRSTRSQTQPLNSSRRREVLVQMGEFHSVFVFARSKGAVSQFGGYVDRETVAQAADTAAL